MKSAVRSLMILAGVLLLSGCFLIDMKMTVSSDDTVSGTMVIAVEESAAAALEEMGEGDGLVNGSEDMPAGATVEPYEQDGYVGRQISFDQVSIDEFNEMFQENGGTFTLTRDGDSFVFEGNLDTGSGSGGADPSAGGADPSDPAMPDMDAMMEQILSSASMSMSMSFPGEVTDTNGEVDGTTVTWDLTDLQDGGEVHATALAEDGAGNIDSGDAAEAAGTSDDSGFPVLPVVIGVVAAIVIIGGILILLRMNKKGTPTM
ncbi:LppM family (lipo)protein [Cumulibacter soli]|uniref:LppM family (lipo)protein n=1 Tax=Cumulibacter soli TaxID=2546344 RepID=UPI001067D5FE|nr:hypothetical protein [Cumulibacter soli]